jgi:hypothetical protein
MKERGFAITNFISSNSSLAILAPQDILEILAFNDFARVSTASKPTLCRVCAYLSPGLPSPTMSHFSIREHYLQKSPAVTIKLFTQIAICDQIKNGPQKGRFLFF